jgi:peptidoglycan/xylan/chitin deacetylase (PgdA/CDA1 family)
MKRPALMYHDVVAPGDSDASGFPGAAAAHYKLDTDEFAHHLAALAGSGLRFGAVTDPSPPDIDCGLLTFDDGGASVAGIGAALAAYHMTGHFFIATERVGQPGFATTRELLALHAEGHVLGSHSHTHPVEISRLGASALDAEWRQSVDILSQLLGEPVTVASVPGGFYSTSVARAAAATGIRYLFTSEPTVNTHRVDGCLVLGRYALWRGMPPSVALALALGTDSARQRQWFMWNVKKPLKRFARPVYGFVRRAVRGRG